MASEQVAMDQADYNGQGGDWVSNAMVGELFAGDGFPSARDAAERVLGCVIGMFYSDTQIARSDKVSTQRTVDGHEAWYLESQFSFDVAGLEAKGERVFIVVVQVDVGEYGLFYGSVPDTSPERLPEVKDSIEKLTVDS